MSPDLVCPHDLGSGVSLGSHVAYSVHYFPEMTEEEIRKHKSK